MGGMLRMNEPLKVRPDFAYAHLCLSPPTTVHGRRTIHDICNEIVADHIPYKTRLYLVAGWQRGLGVFDFSLLVRSEDGQVILEDGPLRTTAYPEGTTNETIPIDFEFANYGTFLIEGSLDGGRSFITILRLTKSDPQK